MGHDQNPRWPVHTPVTPTPSTDWRVGITFGPMTEDEWTHLDWDPTYRIESDQWAEVTPRTSNVLLLAKLCDDDNLTSLLPYLPHAWAVELGNEPSFKGDQSPQQVRAWYDRAIPRIRDAGFWGPIITAGIANLNDDTLRAAYQSIKGLWPDIWFGWHGYDGWQSKIPALLEMLNGRAHAMTESGIPASEGTEAEIAARVAQDIALVQSSGSQTYIFYQLHDGTPGTALWDFGLHAYDGHWRQVEQSLKGAA